MFDYLIVGAGFAGSVLAERLAATEGKMHQVVASSSTFKKIKGYRTRSKLLFDSTI